MHDLKIKTACLVIAAIMLAACFALTAYAETADYYSAYTNTLSSLYSTPAEVGSVCGEWRVFALARSGKYPLTSSYFSNYLSVVEAYVASVGSNVLHEVKSTENSRIVIALTSIGVDARNVAGYDLTAPLKDAAYVQKQGINGVIYALLALNTNRAYSDSATNNALVSIILGRELQSGGWALAGTNADPDVTAAAVTALAPFSAASGAINRAVDKLSQIQNDNGGFSSMGADNSESCSQVIMALSTIGINADTDPRFVKNDGSALSALCSYYTGSGFSHQPGGITNAMASEQAAYSLCAYDRYLRGRSDLYDMSDVAPVSPTPAPTPTPRPTASPTPRPTASPTPKPTVTSTASPSAAPTASTTAAPTAASTATAAPTAYSTDAPAATADAQTTETATEAPADTPAASDRASEAPAAEPSASDPVPVSAATDQPDASSPAGEDDKQAANEGGEQTAAPERSADAAESNAGNDRAEDTADKNNKGGAVALIAGGCALAAAAAVTAAVIIKRRK